MIIQYTLYVSSFTPNTGSIRGGTTVTVYGEGFRYSDVQSYNLSN